MSNINTEGAFLFWDKKKGKCSILSFIFDQTIYHLHTDQDLINGRVAIFHFSHDLGCNVYFWTAYLDPPLNQSAVHLVAHFMKIEFFKTLQLKIPFSHSPATDAQALLPR